MAGLFKSDAGGMKKGIIFLHIPKTGGSSLSKALRKHYPFSRSHVKSRASAFAALPDADLSSDEPGLQEEIQALRLHLILYWAQTGKKFLTGHVWNDKRLQTLRETRYLIVTCLRDPVSRWFSAYLYDRYKDNPHARIDSDIDEFLDSARARAMGSTYVRYIGGVRSDGDYRSDRAIMDAIKMLDTIDILGFLEDLEPIRSQVRERAGLDLKIPHRRRSPADGALSNSIKGSRVYQEAVKDICRPDIELYQYARSVIGK